MRYFSKFFRKPVHQHDFHRIKPISKVFGLDRGTPIDRYYIEKFLSENKHYITGKVIEISENTYSRKFGENVLSFDVLHVDQSSSKATIIGDLTQPSSLPANTFDCFICTQTLNFIYDVHTAIQGMYKLLRNNGVVLVSIAGISQISRYDMDRWGDYWRFTTASALHIFSDVFGKENVTVSSHGNVLSSIAFLEGLASEELTKEELDYIDNDYQLTITVVAKKSLS